MATPVFDTANARLCYGGRLVYLPTTGPAPETTDGVVPQYRIGGAPAQDFRNWFCEPWKYFVLLRVQDADVQSDDLSTIEIYLPSNFVHDISAGDPSATLPWTQIANSTGVETLPGEVPADRGGVEIGENIREFVGSAPELPFADLMRCVKWSGGAGGADIWSPVGSLAVLDANGYPTAGSDPCRTLTLDTRRCYFSADSSAAETFLVRWKGAGSVRLFDTGSEVEHSSDTVPTGAWKWRRFTLPGDGTEGLDKKLFIDVTSVPVTDIEVYPPGYIDVGDENTSSPPVLTDEFLAHFGNRKAFRMLQAGRSEDPYTIANWQHNPANRLPYQWVSGAGKASSITAGILSVTPSTSTYLGGACWEVTHDGGDNFPTGAKSVSVSGSVRTYIERTGPDSFKCIGSEPTVGASQISMDVGIGPHPRLLCELCNAAGVDLWIVVSHVASDAWVREEAEIIRDYLGPGRRVYVEYTNESWNTAPIYAPQNHHCTYMADVLWGQRTSSGLNRYHGRRSAEVHEIFRDVFATGGRSESDIVKVLSSWITFTSYTTERLDGYLERCTDPVAPFPFRAPDHCGPAGYFGNTMVPVVAALGDDHERERDLLLGGHDIAGAEISPVDVTDYGHIYLEKTIDLLEAHGAAIDGWNASNGESVDFGTYEAGTHMHGASMMPNKSSHNWTGAPGSPGTYDAADAEPFGDVVNAGHIHPRMWGLYIRLLEGFRDAGGKLLMHYQSTRYPSDFSSMAVYGWMDQEPGRGDGSDGKFDNLSDLDPYNLSVVSPRGAAIDGWLTVAPAETGDHPRLHVTSATLAALRAKIEADYVSEYGLLVNYAETLYSALSMPYADYSWPVHIPALVSLIGEVSGVSFVPGRTAEQYGERAFEYCEGIVDGVYPVPSATGKTGYDPAGPYSNLARAYDWAYQYATEAQRAKVGGFLASAVSDLISGRQANPNIFSSQMAEREAPWYVAAAIAGDPDLDAAEESAAQAGLAFFDTDMINSGDGVLCALNWVARSKGGYSEIGSYEWHQKRILLQLDGWRTATGEDYFSSDAYAGYPPYWVKGIPRIAAYLLQPYESHRVLPIGQHDAEDEGVADQVQKSHRNRVIGWSVARLAEVDPDMAALARWLVEKGDAENDYNHQLWAWILLGEKVTAQSPAALGLSTDEFFEGLGIYVARSGWDGPADTVLALCSYPAILEGHTWEEYHRPRGLFISKYGPLIHNRTGYLRSPSGQLFSEVHFTDPNGDRAAQWDDTREHRTSGVGTLATYRGTGSTEYVRGIFRRKSTTAYKYVCAQHADAYDSAVENYTRSMVYVPGADTSKPDWVFLLDRTETKESAALTPAAQIRRRWTIGTSYRPTCNGSESVIVGAANPNGPNVAEYTGHAGNAEIEISNSPSGGVDPYSGASLPSAEGKAIVSLLAPSSVKVTVRGGPGSAGYGDHTGGYEFHDDGAEGGSSPYSPPTAPDGTGGDEDLEADYQQLDSVGAFYAGSFAVEAEPVANAAEVDFLAAIQVGADGDAKRAVNAVADAANGFIGAHVEDSVEGDVVVLFADTETDGGSMRTAFAYAISASGPSAPVRHVVCDLAPGTYTVYRDGAIHTSGLVVGEDGVLSWTSVGGSTWSSMPVEPESVTPITQLGPTGLSMGARSIPTKTPFVDLEGSVEVEVDVSGDLSVTRDLEGSVEVEVDVSGDLSVTRDLEGSVEVEVDVSGDLSVIRALEGSVEVEIDVSGALEVLSGYASGVDGVWRIQADGKVWRI